MMKTPKLIISATPRTKYGEHDELEVNTTIHGEVFEGNISVFDNHKKLEDLINNLSDFPTRADDAFEINIGIFDRLNIQFTALEKGLIKVTSKLEKYVGHPVNSYEESVAVRFLCEPWSIDEFHNAISNFEPNKSCEAMLLGRAWQFNG